MAADHAFKKGKTKLHPNSIYKALSFFRMVYNYAIKKGVFKPEINPFQQFELGYYEENTGNIKYLELQQVDALEKALNEKKEMMQDITYRIGWCFLAMCVSGMRISDAMVLNDMIFNDAGDIEFRPHKTRRYGNKAHIPIRNDRQRKPLFQAS